MGVGNGRAETNQQGGTRTESNWRYEMMKNQIASKAFQRDKWWVNETHADTDRQTNRPTERKECRERGCVCVRARCFHLLLICNRPCLFLRILPRALKEKHFHSFYRKRYQYNINIDIKSTCTFIDCQSFSSISPLFFSPLHSSYPICGFSSAFIWTFVNIALRDTFSRELEYCVELNVNKKCRFWDFIITTCWSHAQRKMMENYFIENEGKTHAILMPFYWSCGRLKKLSKSI